MRFLRNPLAVLGLAALILRSVAGEFVIEGTVQIPVEKPAPPSPARYQISATETVSTPEPPKAVVYLEGAFPAPAAPPTVQLGQKGFQFTETLVPVQKGTRVEFPNMDDAYHNVFSYSKPKRFDLGRYRKDEKPASQLFDQPGVVKLYCEIHAHMRSTILVLETPYFVKSEADGRYRLVLKDVPPGQYTLKGWVNERITREVPVQVKDSGSAHIDFPG